MDKSIDWQIIGQNLAFWRGVNQMSREELAGRLCISAERLARLESGEEAFTIDLVVNISLVTAARPCVLLAGTDVLDEREADRRLREVLMSIVKSLKQGN